MEFHSNPPPSPLPQYRYLAKAIITLYPGTSDNSELTRTTSRGSIGRRLSFGSGSKLDEDGDLINQPGNPERGGGLRNFARRLSMDTKKDKDVAAVREGAPQGQGLGEGQQQTGGSQDPSKFKTGKWATNVEVAVTPTHLLVILSPDHPLAAYPPPPGAPGYVRKSSFSKSRDAGVSGGGVGSSGVDASGHTASDDKHASIGRKIIDLFKPGSKDETGKEHVSDSTTGDKTDRPLPADSSTTHAEPIPFPAPTPDMAEKSFPAFVGGQATRYVAVPLGAIKEAEMNLIDDKGEIGVRVPITSHFSSFTHPTDTLGREHDETCCRSGKIKFQFDRNWLGAKAEAEVLQHAIRQAVENRRNAPPQTLSLGGGVGGGAAQAPLGGGAYNAAPLASHDDMDPLDTSSGAKVAGMAA